MRPERPVRRTLPADDPKGQPTGLGGKTEENVHKKEAPNAPEGGLAGEEEVEDEAEVEDVEDQEDEASLSPVVEHNDVWCASDWRDGPQGRRRLKGAR